MEICFSIVKMAFVGEKCVCVCVWYNSVKLSLNYWFSFYNIIPEFSKYIKWCSLLYLAKAAIMFPF